MMLYKLNEEFNMKMTWIAFYEELADVLLKYKDNRKELIKLVEKVFSDIDKPLPTLEKDKQLVDIDPFTIYGTFNKGITNENRVKIITSIKNVFGIKAAVSTDFDGIPVLNNMSATYYSFIDHRKGEEIDNLWKIFELAIQSADAVEHSENIYVSSEFSEYYDKVYNQKG